MKQASTYMNWLVPLIALGPLIHGLLALSSPDLIATNRRWVDPVLLTTMLAIWTAALAAGFRDQDFTPGFLPADKAAIAALTAIALVTTVKVAPATSFSAMFLLMLIAPVLSGLAMKFLLENAAPGTSRRLAFGLFLTMILFLPALALLIAHPPPDTDFIRSIPGYKNVRRWGFLLAACLAIGSALLALPDLRRADKTALFLGLVLLWTATCWSGTRGGILAVIGAVGFSALLAPRVFRPALVPAITAMAIGALISLALPNPSPDFGLWNAASRAASLPGSSQYDASRVSIWLHAIEAIRQRPLFGHGYAQNIWVNTNPVIHTQAHNAVLEVLMAWGLIGGALAVFLGLRLWVSGVRIVRSSQDALRLAALTLITCMGLFGLVDGTLFYADSLFMAAAAAAILFARTPGLPAAQASATQPPS